MKALRADATAADAYVEIDLGSPQTDFWITFPISFTAASLAVWAAGSSGFFLISYDSTRGVNGPTVQITAGPVWSGESGSGGTPVAEASQLVEVHWVMGVSSDVYADGDLVVTGPDFGVVGMQFLQFGNIFAFPTADEIDHISAVKVGTTRGGSELFADDFEGGDLSAWSATSGDVSVVDDPFPETPVFPTFPPDPRFPEAPVWRFALLDLATFGTVTILDRVASQRTVDLKLNAPATATGVAPSDDPEVNIEHNDGEPFLAEGVRVLYGFRREGGTPPWVPRYAGVVLQVEDSADGDRLTSRYTAYDPWQLLNARPCRNGLGDLPGADGLSYTDTDWDVIIGTLLFNTITADGPVMIDAGGDYGGTAYYAGTIETVDAGGANFGIVQGTSVGEAWTQIAALGVADIVLIPIYDPVNRPGYTHELNVYAQAGENRTDTILRLGDTLATVTRLEDGTQRANTIYAFAGPDRELTAGSPHVDFASVTKYGTQVAQLFVPQQNVGGAVDALAERQLALRAAGKVLVSVSPLSDRGLLPFTDYFLGDRLPVWADNSLRKPIVGNDTDGYLRVYGLPIEIGDDALEAVTNLVVSLA